MLIKKLKDHWLFLVILIIGAFLRFYRLPEMAPFDFDQEYAANFAYSVIKEFPIQMVGQGLSVQGLFMGPWYFYYLVPFFWLYKLSPIGGTVGSVFLGLATISVYYFILGKVFGKKVGLIASFLRAISYQGILADLSMTPAFSSELIVIATWYLFYQYWHRQELKFFWLELGFVFGLYTSFHPILFPFYGVFVILMLQRKNWPKGRQIIQLVSGFIVPLLPMILFEYFRKFTEIKTLFSMSLTGSAQSNYSILARIIRNLRIILLGPNLNLDNPELSQYFNTTITVIVLICLAIMTWKRISRFNSSFHLYVVLISIIAFFGYYALLPVNMTEYYLSGAIWVIGIYLAALLGLLLSTKYKKIVLFLVLFFYTFISFRRLSAQWRNPSMTNYYNKNRIVQEILKSQPEDSPFFVSYIKRLGWNFGFNYLFKLSGRTSYDKPVPGSIYTIVIPREMAPGNLDFTSGNIGLIIEK